MFLETWSFSIGVRQVFSLFLGLEEKEAKGKEKLIKEGEHEPTATFTQCCHPLRVLHNFPDFFGGWMTRKAAAASEGATRRQTNSSSFLPRVWSERVCIRHYGNHLHHLFPTRQNIGLRCFFSKHAILKRLSEPPHFHWKEEISKRMASSNGPSEVPISSQR